MNDVVKKVHEEKEYHTIQPMKWQFVAALSAEKVRSISSTTNTFLKFEFIVNNDRKTSNSNVSETELCNDFEQLLNNESFSDMIIKSAEQVEYKVHKAVLASRSAVLKAHFEYNTTECLTNVVESTLESEVLKEVLYFIYSGKAPRVDELPEKLLAAAEYYQLSRLKSLSEEALHKKLTVDNAIDTLQLADLHSAETLKQLTLEFLKDAKTAKMIIKTEGWAKLMSTELIKKIYEYIISDNIKFTEILFDDSLPV